VLIHPICPFGARLGPEQRCLQLGSGQQPSEARALTAYELLRAGLQDRCPEALETRRYSELVQRSRARGDIALGVLLDAGTASQQVVLCPSEDLVWSGTADLIVLTAESSEG